MQSLTTYIKQPELLTAEVVEELAEMVEHNPSFQVARILYLQGLYRLKDARFGEELRKAALFVPDRTTLFHLFDEQRMTPETTKPAAKRVAAGADRTQSLIESFLEEKPDMQPITKGHPVSATVDYMAYLMQQPDVESDDLPDATLDEEDEDDGDFYSDEEDLVADARVVLPTAEPAQTQNVQTDPYFTETLAHIYIKQGKYSKAIEIIRRISLNFPEKNRYFADQIRFLEKLILNERASDNENQ